MDNQIIPPVWTSTTISPVIHLGLFIVGLFIVAAGCAVVAYESIKR